jgi:DHA2 family multidrug resistance protein
MMTVGAILFGSIQLIPQLLQEAYGYTATWSGLSLMPGGFAMLLLMPVAGQLTGKVSPKILMGGGLIAVALSMWHMTVLMPDANFGFFAWARIYQTIGLPFLFIPINTVSYAGLPPEKTNQASALINVARNLGGSIGVSLANTEIAQRSQFHQARLVEHLTPSSINYQQALRRAMSYFGQQTGTDGVAAATGWLGKVIGQQSSILAYIDVFYAAAVFVVLVLPLVFLLRSDKAQRAPP